MEKVKPSVGDIVWITKYALTKGVQKAMCTSACIKFEGMICYALNYEWDMKSPTPGSHNVHGDDWHLDEHLAIERALEMIDRKRVSLKKSIRKLDALDMQLSERLKEKK